MKKKKEKEGSVKCARIQAWGCSPQCQPKPYPGHVGMLDVLRAEARVLLCYHLTGFFGQGRLHVLGDVDVFPHKLDAHYFVTARGRERRFVHLWASKFLSTRDWWGWVGECVVPLSGSLYIGLPAWYIDIFYQSLKFLNSFISHWVPLNSFSTDMF